MTEAGFFCPTCGTVYDEVMACRICQPKEYAKHWDSCPECDGARTGDGCLCEGDGVVLRKQLSLFEELE